MGTCKSKKEKKPQLSEKQLQQVKYLRQVIENKEEYSTMNLNSLKNFVEGLDIVAFDNTLLLEGPSNNQDPFQNIHLKFFLLYLVQKLKRLIQHKKIIRNQIFKNLMAAIVNYLRQSKQIQKQDGDSLIQNKNISIMKELSKQEKNINRLIDIVSLEIQELKISQKDSYFRFLSQRKEKLNQFKSFQRQVLKQDVKSVESSVIDLKNVFVQKKFLNLRFCSQQDINIAKCEPTDIFIDERFSMR